MKSMMFAFLFAAPFARAEQLHCVGHFDETSDISIDAAFSADFKQISNVDLKIYRTDNNFVIGQRMRPHGFLVKPNELIQLEAIADEDSKMGKLKLDATFDAKSGKYTGTFTEEGEDQPTQQQAVLCTL